MSTDTSVYVPTAQMHLGVVPESFDTARVWALWTSADAEYPTVTVDVAGSVKLQTYRGDPVKVADALVRLADRIVAEASAARLDRL